MGYETLEGVVVEPEKAPEPGGFGNGLCLKIDDGRLVELVVDSMARQTSIAMMWAESRDEFAPHIGQRVRVSGYLGGRTLYDAQVVS